MTGGLRIAAHPLLSFSRGRPVTFTFEGRPVCAFEGETVAAALHAAGVRVFSRSMKYHRPRGLLCLSGECSQCLVRADGLPNVRACQTPVREGMRVTGQNAWPSLSHDLMAPADFFGFLLPLGFQYRWFKQERRIYHLFERLLRRAAGVGRLADPGAAGPPPKLCEAAPDVLVAGAGVAGLSAAEAAAREGAKVLLLSRCGAPGGALRFEISPVALPEAGIADFGFAAARALSARVCALPGVTVLSGAPALGWYEEGLCAAARPGELWVIRPGALVVATGARETPVLFPGCDLPGVMPASGARRLMHRDGVAPGRRAVVVGDAERLYGAVRDLLFSGVAVVAVADARPSVEVSASPGAAWARGAGVSVLSGHGVERALGRQRVRGVVLVPSGGRGERISCDVVVVAGPFSPRDELLFQRLAEGDVALDAPLSAPAPPDAPRAGGVYAAGAVNGAPDAASAYREGALAGRAAALYSRNVSGQSF